MNWTPDKVIAIAAIMSVIATVAATHTSNTIERQRNDLGWFQLATGLLVDKDLDPGFRAFAVAIIRKTTPVDIPPDVLARIEHGELPPSFIHSTGPLLFLGSTSTPFFLSTSTSSSLLQLFQPR